MRSFLSLLTPDKIWLLQLIIIVAVGKIISVPLKKIGQPEVVGQIFAGILLGPSLFGKYFPGIQKELFPPASLNYLESLSQIGLIFFMFIVGLEADFAFIKKNARIALFISYSSIILSFALGITTSYYLYKEFAGAGTPFYEFAFFTAIALSLSAFPVLAQILRSLGLSKTELGNLAIACATIDDITAWSLLAILLSLIKGGSLQSSAFILFRTALFVAAVMLFLKPLMNRLLAKQVTNDRITRGGIASILIVLLSCAVCSDLLGMHVLLGSFLAGLIMPRGNKFRGLVIEKMEDICLTVLLPVFFMFTGLRTRLDLLDVYSLGTCLLIITIAIVGKLGGSTIAARFTGFSWNTSLSIGALMNTRGLVELVVVNIGLSQGIITPVMFTILVIMALFTTCMTGPLLKFLKGWRATTKNSPPASA